MVELCFDYYIDVICVELVDYCGYVFDVVLVVVVKGGKDLGVWLFVGVFDFGLNGCFLV